MRSGIPSKALLVKKVFKGIRELHPAKEVRARPLQIEQLQQITNHLADQIDHAGNNDALRQQCLRNNAFLLVGFWRGFRSDELRRLDVSNVEVRPGERLTLYLPRTKTDKQRIGTTYKVPALSRLCPVDAYLDWITTANLSKGPVFRRIDRWGNLGEVSLHTNSIIPLLRKIFQDAGIDNVNDFSSHSLRRGFATWAGTNQWNVKSLMEYIGWKDMKSALRYIDLNDGFNQKQIESAL